MCWKWFSKFKSGNFNLSLAEHKKKIEDEEMEYLLDEDASQTQQVLSVFF